MRISDEHLQYYGDAFVTWVQSGTFEQFLTRSPAMRERQIAAARAVAMQDRIERAMPQFELHGLHLVEPLHRQTADSPVAQRLRRAMK